MPPRTTRNARAKDGGATTAEAASTPTAKYTLEAESTNRPRLYVLPNKATADARIVTLPHPRYAAKPSRFLVCPESGVYEFTHITSPKTEPRSWLITTDGDKTANGDFAPHTTQDAGLFVATPMDPLFLMLPALAADPASASGSASPPVRPRGGGKRMFLTADDHFDALMAMLPPSGEDEEAHLSQLLRHQRAVRDLLTVRMAAICDTVAAGDETMLRLNEDKLLLVLLGKAQRMSQQLPVSLEDKFVTKALEAPVLSVVWSASTLSTTTTVAATAAASTNGVSTPLSTADSLDSSFTADSQASAASATASLVSEASIVSTTSTAATLVSGVAGDNNSNDDDAVHVAMQASDEVVALQRLRVAFQFICSRYVPPAVAATLLEKLKAGGGVDFVPLDAYVAKLAAMRQQTALARSAALEYGNKRGREDEDDDDRAEKRRKQQEEEKRKKAGESRGVRNLKKVNVSGMKKLSEFFKKK